MSFALELASRSVADTIDVGQRPIQISDPVPGGATVVPGFRARGVDFDRFVECLQGPGEISTGMPGFA